MPAELARSPYVRLQASSALSAPPSPSWCGRWRLCPQASARPNIPSKHATGTMHWMNQVCEVGDVSWPQADAQGCDRFERCDDLKYGTGGRIEPVYQNGC